MFCFITDSREHIKTWQNPITFCSDNENTQLHKEHSKKKIYNKICTDKYEQKIQQDGQSYKESRQKKRRIFHFKQTNIFN